MRRPGGHRAEARLVLVYMRMYQLGNAPFPCLRRRRDGYSTSVLADLWKGKRAMYGISWVHTELSRHDE